MTHVYVLSEDDFDDQVYVYLLETLLSVHVELIPLRLRRGGGIGEVRKKLPLLLSEIRRTGNNLRPDSGENQPKQGNIKQ